MTAMILSISPSVTPHPDTLAPAGRPPRRLSTALWYLWINLVEKYVGGDACRLFAVGAQGLEQGLGRLRPQPARCQRPIGRRPGQHPIRLQYSARATGRGVREPD